MRVKNDNRDFVRNLKQACDWSKDVPPLGKGRQTWIASRLGVSQEAVARWLKGDSRPRTKYMRQLANVLNVDESWLALNKQPMVSRAQEKIFKDEAQASTYLIIYFLKLMRYQIAFAAENDDFDLIAIKQGEILKIAISTGLKKSDASWMLPVSEGHREYLNLAVVNAAPGRPDVLMLESDRIVKFAEHTEGSRTIVVERNQDGYFTEGNRWKLLEETDFFGK